MKFSTRAIHVGQSADKSSGATIPPITLSTTFTQDGIGNHQGFEYSRSGNPTRKALEECLASLENAEYGLAFGSGCAATSALIHILKAGDNVVASSEVYGGTYRLFELVLKHFGVSFTWVDGTNPADFAAAMSASTKLVWIETPTNPLMSIFDIRAMSEVAKKGNALLAVDNTFATPYLQSPLALGADIVVHSTTKYIGGHSDVIGGSIMLNDRKLYDRLFLVQKSVGGVPSPFDCYLTLRGIKTLALRMDQHCKSANEIAKWLTKQNNVEKVLFPGLPDHPGYAIAQEQMRGSSGMISFYMRGGRAGVDKFVSKLKLFSLAESLGGVESLCCYPAAMTHASVPKDERDRIGVTDNLLRLSVGIEETSDLLTDLENSLK